jgi:hypothetical protein
VFSTMLAAILRGSQELAPQDDVRNSFTTSQDEGQGILICSKLWKQSAT